MNPHPPVGSRYAALRTALAFEVAPGGYGEGLPICLGLASKTTTPSEVHAAACRLATGVTELLISEAATYTPLLSSDLAAQLADGSLRQYVDQLVSAG